MPVGTKYESVGFAFNKGIITDILRKELGFDGIVVTDWGLITDAVIMGQDMPARAWGCEHLSELERAVKILDAGCDQFGGESRPELVMQAVREGLVTESRIDESVRRVLREKFVLGLFDDKRFVDVENAASVVGNPEFVQEGRRGQRKAFTILTNHNAVLPLSAKTAGSKKFYVEGLDTQAAVNRGLSLVSSPAEADIALVRLRAPFEPRPGGFEARFHAGSLEFPADEVARVNSIIKSVPISVLDVYLDRPAVLTLFVEEQESSFQRTSGQMVGSGAGAGGSGLMVNFGSDTEGFLDVVFGLGDALPQGKLPFDLPRTMDAANNSREDMPFDTKDPLFGFGFGLSYQG